MAILSTAAGPETTPQAGSNTTAGNQSLQQLFPTQVDYGRIAYAANTYGGHTQWATNFLTAPENKACVAAAVEMVGYFENYPGNVYRDHNGWCAAYAGVVNFFFVAILLKKYPKPEESSNNCQILKAYIESLDQEKQDALSKYAADNDACIFNANTSAINMLQGIYRGMYSRMTCDVVIRNQTQAQETAAAQQIQDHATQLQLQQQQQQALIAMQAAERAAAFQLEANAANAANTANIAGTGNVGTNSYLVYGIIGASIILVVGAITIFKKNKTT